MYYNNRLDYSVMIDIRTAKSRGYHDIHDIAGYVCDKWKIDHVKEIREVYRAVKEIYPELVKSK